MGDPDWWRGAVIYQIYPRSFRDASGDGVGDLRGITEKLDHVARLGVDAVWLSPVFTSPMKDMGYDVSDYTDVDPTFGTLADFDAMVGRAHELGLKVMVDQVLSHSSDQHPFFQESRQSRDNPKSDWYIWADPKPDGTEPNNWLAVFGGHAWTWEPRRRQYYMHNFLASQPDWNFWNPAVQDWLLEQMRFWLERGVDGFRLDTVNFYFHDRWLRDNPANPRWGGGPAAARPYNQQYCMFSKNQPENLAFLERMRALMDRYPDRTLVGEVGEGHRPIELMAEYTAGDRRLHMAYSFEMLEDVFTPAHFRRCVERFFAEGPDGWPAWAFSNHDVIRHLTRWRDHGVDEAALAKLCAALLLSLQGSICVYQGEEVGQTETELSYDELTDPQGLTFWPDDKGRDGCRTPMIWDAAASQGGFSEANRTWLPVKEAQLRHAVAAQEGVEGSVLEFYRAMLRLRRERADLRHGVTRFHDVPHPLLGFERGAAGEHGTLCLFNLSAEAQEVAMPRPARPLLGQEASVAEGRVRLGPSGFLLAA